jgi:O-antigen ligase
MLVVAWIAFLSSDSTTIAQSMSFFTYEKFASTVGVQPIYLSMYMVFSFFAVIWDFFIDPRIGLTKSGKLMAFTWAFHFFMMVILLSSRMELLVLLFVSFVGIAYFDAFKKKSWSKALIKILVFTSATIFLLGVIPINKARYSEMVDMEKDYKETKWGGRSIRIHKWMNTLELISEQPLLGTGSGDMQNELQKVYQRNNFEIAYKYRFNPHNQYLQTWASSGLIGLFFLFGILLVSLIYAIRSKNALYVGLVLVIALSMLTESMLERQKGLVFFSFFLLFFGGYYFNHKERQSLHPKP